MAALLRSPSPSTSQLRLLFCEPLLVIVSFPLLDQPDVAVLAWTTTPWTLPSNLGLCVHPTFDYVHITGPRRCPSSVRHP